MGLSKRADAEERILGGLHEFYNNNQTLSEAEQQERQSGDAAWRSQRGEMGGKATCASSSAVANPKFSLSQFYGSSHGDTVQFVDEPTCENGSKGPVKIWLWHADFCQGVCLQ